MANFNWTFVNVDGVVNVNAISSSTYISASTIYATTITASNYIVDNVHVIDATGSTTFGDSNDDMHARTGSLSVYKTADTATLPAELLRLEIGDEGADMNIGSGPGIDFFVGETGGSDYAGTIAVIREQAADANTDSAMVFHTTTDDQVKANDREKMRITSAGKVGIGTTNPAKTLTVVGEVSASATITGSAFETATTFINATHVSSSLNISASAFYGDGSLLTGISPITTYSNASDNRVITSVNGSSINSEANLTFDGSKLAAAGQISASLGVTGSSLETATTVISSTHISSSLNVSGAAFYGDGSLLTGISPITTYSNASDNRVITSVNSSTISGEANLTFDGSKLSAAGQISASLGITGSVFETLTTVINSTHISSSLNISASEFYGNGARLTGMSPITGYTNVSNNRVLTAVDSSTINGEANLTFDGADLTVKSSTSGYPRILVQNENADDQPGKLVFHKTSSSPADNDMIGQMVFLSYDGAGNPTTYAQMTGEIKKFASGGERGKVKFEIAEYDGSLTEGFSLQGDNSDGSVSVTVSNGTLYLPNGNVHLYDDKKIVFGNGSDASFEYDEDGTDTLLYAGASMRISDDVKVEFGSAGESHIFYRETSDNYLVISGSAAGAVISGSKLVLDTTTVASGAIAGPGSYLGVTSTGQVVLTASSGGGGDGTPGGSDTQIQYNNGGAFGAIAAFTWDDTNINIADDTKLRFGNGGDASIEYDENGTDELRFAGANVIFEQDVTLNGANAYFKSATSNRPRVYIENQNADANPGQLIFNKTSSSPANDDVIGSIVFSSYDAGGAATVYGQIKSDIKTVTAGGERGRVRIYAAEYDGTLTEGLTVQGGNTNGVVDVTVANGGLNVPNGNLTMYDDRKLYFGSNIDAHIVYDEAVSDKLIISGAHGGTYFSGSGGVTVATDGGLTVTSETDDEPNLIIENTSDGVGGGSLTFKRTTTDEAANDIIGNIQFMAKDAAGNDTVYAGIQGLIDDATSGGEEGRLVFKVAEFDGNQQEGFRIEGQASNGIVNCLVSNGSLQFKDLGGAGTTPASGFGGLYVNADKLYFINDSGGSTELGAGASASGNNTFSGTNTFSAALTASTGIDLGGGLSYATSVKTLNFTAALNEYLFFCDLTGSVITGTLPPAATAGAGKAYIFKDVSGSASTFNLVISGSGVETIDGADQVKITSNSGSVTCVSNGNNWFIIGTS